MKSPGSRRRRSPCCGPFRRRDNSTSESNNSARKYFPHLARRSCCCYCPPSDGPRAAISGQRCVSARAWRRYYYHLPSPGRLLRRYSTTTRRKSPPGHRGRSKGLPKRSASYNFRINVLYYCRLFDELCCSFRSVPFTFTFAIGWITNNFSSCFTRILFFLSLLFFVSF